MDPTRTNTPPTEQANDQPSVETIEAEIAQTRVELTRTIDEIEQRLSPRNLVDQAKDSIKEATIGRFETMMDSASDTAAEWAGRSREAATDVVDHVKDNPMPAAMLGLGLGWLFYSMRSSTTHGRNDSERWVDPRASRSGSRLSSIGSTIGDHPVPALIAGAGLGWLIRNAWAEPQRPGAGFYPAQERPTTRPEVGERLASLAETAQEGVRTAQESVRDVASRARAEVGRYSGQVQQYSGRVQNDLGRMIVQNPLAFGVAALAVGAAVGMSVPETDLENAYLGEARDSLVDRAQDATKQAVSKVQETVKDQVAAVTRDL